MVLQEVTENLTALKTMSLRIRGAKTELEDMGEDTDGMAESVSKLRDEIKALTGVDLMIDDSTFKSTYQQLKEISEVWDKLSDVSQANVLELLFAKRQSNVGAALLENFDMAEAATKTAEGSLGSATQENDKYLQSIQGHLDQLAASFQNLSTTILDSGLVKFGIDVLKTITDAATGLAKINMLLPTIAAGFLAIQNAKSAGGTKTTVLFDTPARVLVATRNEYAA